MSAKPSKLCEGKNRRGEPCGHAPTPGRPFCRHHGGRVKAGKAHPNYKNGRTSRYVPKALRGAYAESLSDPQRLSLAREIAILDARLQQLYQSLDTKGTDTAQAWQEIGLSVDRRGRLVDLETRHMRELGGMVPVDQLFLLVDAMADIIAREVASPEERDRITDLFERELLGAPGGSAQLAG